MLLKDAQFKKLPAQKTHVVTNLQNLVSFNAEVRQLVEILNREMAAPENIVFRPASHPAGFTRLITKRRLTIAEAYLKLISLTRASDYNTRIEALSVLMHQVWHSKNLSMPMNIARIQIALMKACVKNNGNKRKQYELMSDFAKASYGQTAFIRKLLRRLDLIEVPETGENLSQLNLGWDDHVHDSLTEGRKSPTQLVLDAFIKGMSRITVSYYDIEDTSVCEEILKAGAILGINVKIGVEFSIGTRTARTHFMYIPPQDGSATSFHDFFESKRSELQPFISGLQENSAKRKTTANNILDYFNNSGLKTINNPYDGLPILQMQPIMWETIQAQIPRGQISRIHIAQLIFQALKPVALKRLLYLKNQYRYLTSKHSNIETGALEINAALEKYEAAREEYEKLTPTVVSQRYIATTKQLDYNSAFETPEQILPLLKQCGGEIVFIHPVARGPQNAIDFIFDYYPYITGIEVFNLVHALQSDPSDPRRLSTLIDDLHKGKIQAVKTLLQDWRLTPPDDEKINAAAKYLQEKPFTPTCGSDAVGWSANIPGMGFVFENDLSKASKKLLLENKHSTLDQPTIKLFHEQITSEDDDGKPRRDNIDKGSIYLLASTLPPPTALVGDEDENKILPPSEFWRYLNTYLKSLILAGVGFIPAYYVLGLNYALLWFFMTSLRNFIVDQISAAGIQPWKWQFKNLDKENLANSLLWTGFSVPLLYWAKIGFDSLWFNLGGTENFLFQFLKFWVIAFTNGLYLASHNTLRGFDKAAVRGNFFRSVLSWPLAAVGSYALTPLGIPDIVQAKIWSEVVAATIEGTVKFLRHFKLAQKAVIEIYNKIRSDDSLISTISRIDLLFIWAKQQQGKKAILSLLKMNERTKNNFSPEQTEQILQTNEILHDRFITEGSIESLSYVILEYYSEDNVAGLIDFIGQYHDPFVNWLEKNTDYPKQERNRFKPKIPPII